MSAAHMSSLGLAGLHLELVTSTVNSLAARAGQAFRDDEAVAEPRSYVVARYEEQLENQSIARDAFRAELERTTGLPAALIERRLAL